MNIEATQRVYAAAYKVSTNSDKTKSLVSLQEKAQKKRRAILVAQAEAAAEREKILACFAPAVAQEKIAKIDERIADEIHCAKTELHEELSNILSAKQEQFRTIAFAPPTQQQVALLQALALRDDLTIEEVASVAEQMSDNHQSMRTLVSIARKAGVDIHISFPSDDFNEAMQAAERYYTTMINAITTKENDLDYHQREFYNYHDLGTAHYYSDMLDSCLFSAPQVQKQTDLEYLIKQMESYQDSNPEKAKRIEKFIRANEARLMSEDDRLARDIELLLKED